MKKFGILLLALCMLCAVLTACKPEEPHTHVYNTEWASDDTHHWHACTDASCTEVADKAEHTFGDANTCTVCGKAKPAADTPAASIDYNKVTDRVYSLVGEENNGVLSVALNEKGSIVMLTSHDCDLSLDDEWGDIATFTYDNTGKMTSVTMYGETVPVIEYDSNGRPTKIGDGEFSFTMFAYDETDIIISFGDEEFVTLDQYGRVVKLEERWDDEVESYVLTFDGGVGTWEYSEADEDDEIYTVTYANNNKMTKYVETFTDGTVSYFYEYTYTNTGLPSDVLFVEEPDDTESREGERVIYEYDTEERLSKAVFYYIEGETETKEGEIVYEYGANGKLSKETAYEDGEVYSTNTYEYDDKGNLIKDEYTYEDGKKRVYEYAYNENGDETYELYARYESGEVVYKEEVRTEYHANGYASKETRVELDLEDGRHNETIEEFYENGWRSTQIDISYDEEGNKQHERIEEYRPDGTRSSRTEIYYNEGVESNRYTEEFDENGNPVL